MSNASPLTGVERSIADKILHILAHFPKVSPSMLQISLGSGVPTDMWKPVLEALIREGEVHRYSRTVVAPSGRQQVVTVISSSPDGGSPITED